MPPLAPDKRDDFKPTGKSFCVPADVASLEPLVKRRVAVCSLFANQNMAVRDIARILGVEFSEVVKTLIAEGLVLERRQNAQRSDAEQPPLFFHKP
jgi:hypothetical protein